MRVGALTGMGVGVGGMKTNMSGKLSLSVELNEGKEVEVKIVRK